MEGLIPYLINAMRKQKPGHHYRSMSAGSSRSYHLLMGHSQPESVEGSSHHRRTRSEFQPAGTAEFFEQRRSGLDFLSPSKSYNDGSSAAVNYPSSIVGGGGGSNVGSYAHHRRTSMVNTVQVSDVRRR